MNNLYRSIKSFLSKEINRYHTILAIYLFYTALIITVCINHNTEIPSKVDEMTNTQEENITIPMAIVEEDIIIYDGIRFISDIKKEEIIVKEEEPFFPILDQKATRHDDLCEFEEITEDQLNYIIDEFDKICGGTPFKGNAHIFIEASELSGLNPLYLFAHASLETGYGKSSLAVNKGNYFGIGAYDYNPNKALYMGDTMRDGICNGAIWIKENFYDNSQTTLHDMIYKYENHFYASDGDNWINKILWIMNKYTI